MNLAQQDVSRASRVRRFRNTHLPIKNEAKPFLITLINHAKMNSFALCELCSDNGPFYCCFSACPTCGEKSQYCAACWGRWATVCEDEGRPKANCPHCRSSLCETMVIEFLGRPYKPRPAKKQGQQARTASPREDSQGTIAILSPLELQRCPACHVWVDREYGYNDMECRCGAHFRWFSGQDDPAISANVHQVHFSDHVTREHETDVDDAARKQELHQSRDAEKVRDTHPTVISSDLYVFTREYEAKSFLKSWKSNYKFRPRTNHL